MANSRAKGIARISLTIPETLLAQIEAEAMSQGVDRLELIRRAITTFLQAALIERAHGKQPMAMVAETQEPSPASRLPRKTVTYPRKKQERLRVLPPPEDAEKKAN